MDRKLSSLVCAVLLLSGMAFAEGDFLITSPYEWMRIDAQMNQSIMNYVTQGATLTWGPMDYWLALPSSACAVSTVITPTILQNGTIGQPAPTWNVSTTPLTGVTCAAKQNGLGGSVIVQGVTYANTSANQVVAFDNAQHNQVYTLTPLPLGIKTAVENGIITIGQTSMFGLMDMAGLFDNLGHYCMFQLSGSGSTFVLQIETDGSGTLHSGTIPVTSGRTYTFSLLCDEVGGTSKLAVYDPSNSYAQVGSTVTVVQKTGNYLTQWINGNNESGTDAGTTSYEENWMLDFLYSYFPNSPSSRTISGPLLVQTPAITACGFNSSCTQNVASVTGGNVLAVGSALGEGTPASFTIGSTGAGCASTVWTQKQSQTTNPALKIWTGVASGTGACNVTVSFSPAVFSYVGLVEIKPQSTGTIDTGGNTNCATAATCTLNAGSTTAVSNELAVVFFNNNSDSSYPLANNWAGYGVSNVFFGMFLQPVANSGSTPSFPATGLAATANTSVGMVTVEP